MPEWHRNEHAVIIEQIIGPLADLRPDLGQDKLILRARTIFAAVHGVVFLALQGKFVGVPQEHLSAEVTSLVGTLVRGSMPGG